LTNIEGALNTQSHPQLLEGTWIQFLTGLNNFVKFKRSFRRANYRIQHSIYMYNWNYICCDSSLRLAWHC